MFYIYHSIISIEDNDDNDYDDDGDDDGGGISVVKFVC